jgi:hypothetical protein
VWRKRQNARTFALAVQAAKAGLIIRDMIQSRARSMMGAVLCGFSGKGKGGGRKCLAIPGVQIAVYTDEIRVRIWRIAIMPAIIASRNT